jgi:hypothetical protein
MAFFVFFAISRWQYLLLPIVIAMGAFHGAVINWFEHKYYYINFKLRNRSMNLFFIDIFMLGESLITTITTKIHRLLILWLLARDRAAVSHYSFPWLDWHHQIAEARNAKNY